MEPVQISESELVLMRIIWARGGTALFAFVAEAIEEQGLDWRRTTTLTFLSRLVEKGLLTVGKIGRRNEYTANISEEDYNASQTRLFLDKVYEGNVSELVNTLLRKDMISQDDKEALRRFWNEDSQND